MSKAITLLALAFHCLTVYHINFMFAVDDEFAGVLMQAQDNRDAYKCDFIWVECQKVGFTYSCDVLRGNCFRNLKPVWGIELNQRTNKLKDVIHWWFK